MTKHPLTDREKLVIKCWNEQGLSQTQIAQRLMVTKSTVAAIINRIRAKGWDMNSRTSQSTKVREAKKVREVKAEAPKRAGWADFPNLPGEKAVPAILHRQPLLRAPGQLDVPFADVTAKQCKWPAWPMEEKVGPVCGLPVAETFSYCEYHRRTARTLPKAT